MGASLIEPFGVQDDGRMDWKLLLYEKKHYFVKYLDGIVRIRIDYLRVSSRGNTEDPSVIRNHWV